jgi:hypothetical protein
MHEEIRKLLSPLDNELAPLRQMAESLIDQDSLIDPTTGAALISRRTKIAPEAFACVIYPGMPHEAITRYEEIHSGDSGPSFTIPDAYKTILSRCNGAEIIEMNLYGLPPSMCNNPPLLSRSSRQPLDLATANKDWRRAFQPDPTQFHFGGAYYSPEENLAYFLNPDGEVEALRKGKTRFNLWPNFESFLSNELSRLIALYPAYEQSWFELRQSWEAEAKSKRKKPRSKK